jgi:MFS family permease
MPTTRIHPVSSAPKSLWSREIYWFVISLGFIWALVYNILPVSFPAFRNVFGATTEQMGRSQLLYFIGGLIYTAVGGVFIDRLGLRWAAIVTVLSVAATLAIIGSAPGMPLIMVGAFGFGIAMASLDVVCSALIARHFAERRQSVFLLYAANSSFGGILGPAALGWWQIHGQTPRDNWRIEYYVLAAVLVPLAAWGLRIRTPEPLPQGVETVPDSGSLAAMTGVLGEPAIYLLGLAYFLHSIAQAGMISWVGQLYQRRYSIDSAHAAYFLSFDLAGFFLGRSLLGWITARWRISELLVMAVCAGLATLGYVATIAAPGYAWGLVSFMISGFFISADGPSINSYAGLHFGERAAHAYVLLSGIASIGSAAGAYFTALLGAHFGLEKGIWFVPGFSAALALLATVWWARDRRSLRKPAH